MPLLVLALARRLPGCRDSNRSARAAQAIHFAARAPLSDERRIMHDDLTNDLCPWCGARFRLPRWSLIPPPDWRMRGRRLWLAECSGCNAGMIGETTDRDAEAESAAIEAEAA